MRSWVLGGVPGSSLVKTERSERVLAPNEVRVELLAASLNARDLMMQDSPPRAGKVPLSDGAGDAVEVGEAVSGLMVETQLSEASARTGAKVPCATRILPAPSAAITTECCRSE